VFLERHLAALSRDITTIETSLGSAMPDSVREAAEYELLLLKACRSLLVNGDAERASKEFSIGLMALRSLPNQIRLARGKG
jgi:hypothetical protein